MDSDSKNDELGRRVAGSQKLHRIVLALGALSFLVVVIGVVTGFVVHADDMQTQSTHVSWAAIASLSSALVQAWVLVFSGLVWRLTRAAEPLAASAALKAVVCSTLLLGGLVAAFLSGARIVDLSAKIHLWLSLTTAVALLGGLVLEARWLSALHRQLGLAGGRSGGS